MAMAQRSWTDSGFLLSAWEVRPRHGTLRRRGDPGSTPIQIEPRVMAVLACLARHAGEVVTRDEFIAEVWDGRVVSDESLSRCISVLRHVLADDSHEPRFIRTVARIGYTLLQAPEPLVPAGAEDELPAAPPPTERTRWARRLRSQGLRRYLAAGVVCLAIVVGAALYLLRALHPGADAPRPPVTRLLVLPFDTSQARDFGRDVGNELADEISDSLAHVERLRISGRTSAGTLAASHASAVEAGRRLGVDAVLAGAVAESPQGLRVAVRLTTTSDARVLWSRVYERKPEDIFTVQSSIASAVVRELVGPLTREGLAGVASVEPDSRDLQAYQLYLRGAHQVRLRGEDSLRMAVDLFSAALGRDPTYARAQVGLANAYALLPSYTLEDPSEMYALAEKALTAAERLARSRSVSAGTRAYLGFMRRQWIDAETAFRTAIAVDPNNSDVRQMYSQLLGAMGRLDAALAQAKLAQELDPLAPVVADRIGVIHLWLGQDAEATKDVALARELGLEEAAYPETKIILKLHQHADAEAADALRRIQQAVNRSDAWIKPTLNAYRYPDKRPAAIALLGQAQKSGAISARIYFGAMVLLESPERAMHAFADLIERDANDLEFLFSVDAAAVRRDPAFEDFVRKMGLEEYWNRFGWPTACRREGSRIACH
jgi:DNA-binding winged helix-turn-helix (wHTH) protein/TolB-like protein/tetratricopeptide (TPR) repeat protein